MPAEPLTTDPEERTLELPRYDEADLTDNDGPYVVILYNDDYHGQDEVVVQLQKATGYNIERCIRIMWETHTRGRAIAYTGSESACERAATILRQIRLQVETDRF